MCCCGLFRSEKKKDKKHGKHSEPPMPAARPVYYDNGYGTGAQQYQYQDPSKQNKQAANAVLGQQGVSMLVRGANMHTNGKYSKYITEDRVNKGLNKGVEAYEKHQQKKAAAAGQAGYGQAGYGQGGY